MLEIFEPNLVSRQGFQLDPKGHIREWFHVEWPVDQLDIL